MIVDHEAVPMAAWQRLAELLQGSLGCGMFGDAVVKNPPGVQFHDDEYIKDADPAVTTVKKSDRVGVVAKESQPALGWIGVPTGTVAAAKILPCRTGRHPDSQFQFQFVGDPFLPPGDAVLGHGADQYPEILWQRRPSHGPRFPAPEQAEPLAVPADNSVRLDDDESALPVKPPAQNGP